MWLNLVAILYSYDYRYGYMFLELVITIMSLNLFIVNHSAVFILLLVLFLPFQFIYRLYVVLTSFCYYGLIFSLVCFPGQSTPAFFIAALFGELVSKFSYIVGNYPVAAESGWIGETYENEGMEEIFANILHYGFQT